MCGRNSFLCWAAELLRVLVLTHRIAKSDFVRVGAAGLTQSDLVAAAASEAANERFVDARSGFADYERFCPWLFDLRLASKSTLHARIRMTFLTDCPGNGTLLPGGLTYSDIGKVMENGPIYDHKNGIDQAVLFTLLARGQTFNRHLWECPAAVLKALEVWTYEHTRASKWDGIVYDDVKFNKHMKQAKDAGECMRFLQKIFHYSLLCDACSDELKRKVETLRNLQISWQTTSWLKERIDWHQQDRADEPLKASLSQPRDNTPLTDQEQWELHKDGAMLLNRLKAEGLLESWVVSHSSMLSCMRYGHTRGVALPSGHRDFPTDNDFDAHVVTDRWSDFTVRLERYALELGFTWCGWILNWPPYTFCCRRGSGELDIRRVRERKKQDSGGEQFTSLIFSIEPTIPCLAKPLTVTTDRPTSEEIRRAAVTVPLELPCPRDPLGLMRFIYRHLPQFGSCLALPYWKPPYSDSDKETFADGLSEEDVRFLWTRAVELRKGGFANMGQYFADCRDHPLSNFAQSLYWGLD